VIYYLIDHSIKMSGFALPVPVPVPVPVSVSVNSEAENAHERFMFLKLAELLIDEGCKILKSLWQARWLTWYPEGEFPHQRYHVLSRRLQPKCILDPAQWDIVEAGDIDTWDISIFNALLRFIHIHPASYSRYIGTLGCIQQNTSYQAIKNFVNMRNNNYAHLSRTALPRREFEIAVESCIGNMKDFAREIERLRYFTPGTMTYTTFRSVEDLHGRTLEAVNNPSNVAAQVQELEIKAAMWENRYKQFDTREARLLVWIKMRFPVSVPDNRIPGVASGQAADSGGSGPAIGDTGSIPIPAKFSLHFVPEEVSTGSFNVVETVTVGCREEIEKCLEQADEAQQIQEDTAHKYVAIENSVDGAVVFREHIVFQFDALSASCWVSAPFSEGRTMAGKVYPMGTSKSKYEGGKGINIMPGEEPIKLENGSDVWLGTCNGQKRKIHVNIKVYNPPIPPLL
jgi:hypothetical protein